MGRDVSSSMGGTTTKRDTVNTALRESMARKRRLRALHELRVLTDEAAFDAELLLDKRDYRGGRVYVLYVARACVWSSEKSPRKLSIAAPQPSTSS
ncbi:hypothetical protein [Streptomyces sp. NPDC006147]|uniref:hypothetical protein n=1 Tax=unclassified Streptomyces TaxID=2593676 RepID=UPI0033A8D68F